MNRQNYEDKDRFPLSTQALTFMQNMVFATAELARIGGNNYILSGCKKNGNVVAPGTIVINGEPMPFTGGAEGATITIVETIESVSADGITFPKARVTRTAKFATGTGANYLSWTNFKRLETNDQLAATRATIRYVDEEINKVADGRIPAGVIVMWGGSEAEIPVGWVLCDGRTLQSGIKVPNLRGRFVVGYNSTEGSGYTTIGAGAKNPDQYNITLTTKEMPKHNHGVGTGAGSAVANGQAGLITRSSGGNDTGAHSDPTAGEPNIKAAPVGIPLEGEGAAFDARPPYYVLAYIIKI